MINKRGPSTVLCSHLNSISWLQFNSRFIKSQYALNIKSIQTFFASRSLHVQWLNSRILCQVDFPVFSAALSQLALFLQSDSLFYIVQHVIRVHFGKQPQICRHKFRTLSVLASVDLLGIHQANNSTRTKPWPNLY